eukprot:10305501-Alexandrium_andersonii.AAC.1
MDIGKVELVFERPTSQKKKGTQSDKMLKPRMMKSELGYSDEIIEKSRQQSRKRRLRGGGAKTKHFQTTRTKTGTSLTTVAA